MPAEAPGGGGKAAGRDADRPVAGGAGNSARPAREGARNMQALERMGKPQPKPAGMAAPLPLDVPVRPGGSGSATGFVGTLARDALDVAEGVNPSGETRTGRLNLPMAREIRPRPRAPEEAAGTAAKKESEAEKTVAAAGEQGRNKRMAGWLLAPAVILGAAGVWAAGAVYFMTRVIPSDAAQVRYPFLAWRDGDYTAATQTMAWGLLACLPLAGLLLAMAVKSWRGRA